MTTSAAALKAQFDLQTRLFNNVLEGITDAESHKRNNEHLNHIKWIAGHLLNTRVNSISKIVGLQPDESYVAQFARGATLDPNGSYPSIEDITSKWKATASTISDSITKMPEEKLSATTTVKTPIADDTFRGLLAFLISHEAYHIGQLSLLRKMIGKEAMSYN